MTESEWKILRQVKEAALDRLCKRILDQSQGVIQGQGTNHERYLRLFDLIAERNREIARAFDGLRRSVAEEKLLQMVRLGLVTDEELARFEPETREWIEHVRKPLRFRGERD